MLIHPTHRLSQKVRPFWMLGPLHGKTVASAWQPDQFHIDASFFHLVEHEFGHAKRDQGVGISVQQQHR